jgi:hypothetical protein
LLLKTPPNPRATGIEPVVNSRLEVEYDGLLPDVARNLLAYGHDHGVVKEVETYVGHATQYPSSTSGLIKPLLETFVNNKKPAPTPVLRLLTIGAGRADRNGTGKGRSTL